MSATTPTPSSGLPQVLVQLRELWGRQPRARKLLAIAVVLGVAGWIAWTSLSTHTAAWTKIADGTSPEDAHEMLAALQQRAVPARLREGNVEVPTERAEEARAVASAAGLPRTGKGFELFDGANLGQSSFAEQVNYRRALQGELARSIAALAQVQGARVHLALGKRSVFKDRDEAPSASVALHLYPGQQLGNEQVRGVRQLVAASVEGMQASAVVIVDNHGNLLDAGEPGATDRKAALEQSVTARVRTMLERVVGAGKVSVVATAVVDDRKISETQELYDNANPALRSESRTVEGADATGNIGGIAGTRGNLPGAPAAAAAPGSGGSQRLQETKNYEISRTVRQTVNPDSQLQRLHLAVVVDYKSTIAGVPPIARTPAELAELTAIARNAAGIDDKRGDTIEVHSLPFVPDPADAVAPTAAPAVEELPLVPLAIGAGAVLFVMLVLVIAAIRRRRKRNKTPQLSLPAPIAMLERVLDVRPEISAPSNEPPALPEGRGVRDRVLDAVRSDVDRAAGVLAGWLAEPGPATKAPAAPQKGAHS